MPGEEPTSFNDTAGGGGSPQQRRDVPTQHVFQAVIRDPSSLSPQRPPHTQYPPSLARFSNVASLTSSWVIAKEGPLPYIPITMPLPPVCPSSRSFMSPSPNLGMPLHDLQRVGDRDGEMDVFQGGGFGTLGGVGGGGMGGVGVSGGGASSSSPCTSTLPLTLTHSPPLQVHAEERDSYDTTTPVHPYHPACWKGKLPGPGLMEVDRILEEVAPGYRKS
ncbi:uncharacterized protein EI90DRAFT_3060782 [Cantharellus anzutake]|uniref:uncharacterized protein n=1 Tax=Cantharellus anzutake TaxID=1750568 RepID=UPI0019048E7E|nr:uncharacterized protein EI90DRAFT_3060782 [Cantharellus anzutake]KAF8330449.1 hypothetical protein EI90DRAFT_3060782 [Cantharellus anzutake]